MLFAVSMASITRTAHAAMLRADAWTAMVRPTRSEIGPAQSSPISIPAMVTPMTWNLAAASAVTCCSTHTSRVKRMPKTAPNSVDRIQYRQMTDMARPRRLALQLHEDHADVRGVLHVEGGYASWSC